MKKVFSLILFGLLSLGAYANELQFSVKGNWVTFKAIGPEPFVLLTPNIKATYPRCHVIVIYLPPNGLPKLTFRIGNSPYESPEIRQKFISNW